MYQIPKYKVTQDERARIAEASQGITVDRGAHIHDPGACVMEWVTKLGRLSADIAQCSEQRVYGRTDHPFHADQYLTSTMIAINDGVSGDNRQLLAELVPWLVGSSCSHELSQKRMRLLAKAFIKRVASKLPPGLCQQLCPIANSVENDSVSATDAKIRSIRLDPDYEKMPLETKLMFCHLMVQFRDGEIHTDFISLIKDQDLMKERAELRYFIDTVIDILKTT